MTENRSLDDFLGGDSETEAESDGDDESAADADGSSADGGSTADAADGSVEDTADDEATDAPAGATPEDVADDPAEATRDDVAPAVGTYRWDPDGVDCPACGETVDRLWADDDEQVCVDCKAW